MNASPAATTSAVKCPTGQLVTVAATWVISGIIQVKRALKKPSAPGAAMTGTVSKINTTLSVLALQMFANVLGAFSMT